jgi:hypothetical protein
MNVTRRFSLARRPEQYPTVCEEGGRRHATPTAHRTTDVDAVDVGVTALKAPSPLAVAERHI